MKITTEDQQRMGEILELLSWFEDFSTNLPMKQYDFDVDGFILRFKYMMTWTDGWLDGALWQSKP